MNPALPLATRSPATAPPGPDLAQDHVLVVGEALLDVVHRVDGSVDHLPGGSLANVALTLGRLERPTQLVTWIGDDAPGAMIRRWLEESGVSVAPASVGAPATSVATARLDDGGAATYEFDIEWSVPQGSAASATTIAVHTGSIAGVLEPGASAVRDLVAAARATATITYDPNVRPALMGDRAQARQRIEELVALSDVVKVSDEDLAWLVPGSDPVAVAHAWRKLGPAIVIVTLGGAGAVAVDAAGEQHVRAPRTDVVDTVGAGDSFMGALIDGLWELGLLGAARRSALGSIEPAVVTRLLERCVEVAAITVSRPGANPPARAELEAPGSPAWRDAQLRSLLSFGEGSLGADGGALWLDDDGRPDLARPAHTWITSRMAHVYSLASLLGVSGAQERADLALHGLATTLADAENGGWLSSRGPVDPDRRAGADAAPEPVDGTKSAYAHAFVVLAAASGTIAGREGARELLDTALAVLDEQFWEPAARMHADERSQDWSVIEDYRGVNANMHAVEALLAAFDATGDGEWLARAESIADRVIGWAQAHEWRIPEHFDAAWNPLLEYNADRPRDPFKPYGSTPGHGLEWARLVIQLDVAAGTTSRRTEAAVALFDRAVADGWDGEHGGGFVYTVDWAGAPVEPRRYHWVAAEAVAAASVLGRVTGDPRFARLAAEWWRWIDEHLVDREHGSWHHELDAKNTPDGVTWVGKPDIYHAVQALLLPDLPIAGSLAGSASRVDGHVGNAS